MQLQEMHVQPPSSRYSLNSDGVYFVKKRFSPDLSNGVYTAIGDEEDSFTVNSRRKLLPIVFTVVLILLSMGAFLLSFQRTILTTALSKTTPFKPVVHPDLPTSYWGTTPKPYPTGAFWTNLVVKDGDGAIGLYPYGIRTVDTGIQVSYGAFRRHVTNQAIADIFTSDLEVSAMENYVSRGVESHDNISVTMTYKTINNGKFSTHLVKCSPFVTVVYTSSTPVLRSPLMHIIAVDARVMQNSTGVQYIVTLGNFQKWLVYCSVPVSLVWTEDTLTSAVPISGVVRVAVLPIQTAEAAFATLLQYVGKYPISATTSVSFLDLPVSTATITYAFKTVGSGPLLMLALPHQIPLFQSPAINNAEHLHLLSVYEPIYSIKGKLRPIVGDSWRLTYSLVTAGWNYVVTETLGIDQLNTIAFNLLMDVNNVLPTAVDPYTFGKQLGRMCTIALMADNLGIAAVRTTALLNIETALTPWLTGTNTDALLFDRTYGGVVSSAGLADQYADFGSGWYSDHHFHYGYFINAGAVLAKLDRPYFDANKNAFDALVRDVANYDATDTDFPIARHKDMFDGHSWASGLYQQSNGKGQESSSEVSNHCCFLNFSLIIMLYTGGECILRCISVRRGHFQS
jgi:endo-1,3(4)-beta-glucanase